MYAENGEAERTGHPFYKLSSHLSQVLTDVGVSEELRGKYMMAANVHEILTTVKLRFMHPQRISCYLFGSSFEGTTTQGLWSDRDALYCFEDTTVVESINNATHNGHSLLMLTDGTKPGFVKLQDVFNGTPLTNSYLVTTSFSGRHVDSKGRLLWKHFNFEISLYETEVNGPALTSKEFYQDYVVALRCRSIPSFSDEWLHRIRPHQWPSQIHLKRLSSYGCFLVGIGHSKSRNKVIEWRISFSLQERDLMSCLNPTQHKCYVLLKMIKKDIIQDRVRESISSYHCKTCLFHLIESTGDGYWTESNLINALLQCLQLLLRWASQKNCPNYFNKEENMFDRLDADVLNKTTGVLQSLLSGGVDFLFGLKLDGVGTLLTKIAQGNRLAEIELNVKKRATYELYVNMMKIQLSTRQCYYRNLDNTVFPPDWFSRSIRVLQHLEQIHFITEHDPRDVRMILNLFLPHIRVNIAQTIASTIILDRNDNSFYEILNAFEKELEYNSHCDIISSRLVLATVYLQINRLISSEKILMDCDSSLREFVVATCGCHDYPLRRNKHLQEKMIGKDLTFTEFQRELTAACMIFLPSQSNIVHPALRYEMYRSMFTPPESKDKCLCCWFDWIVVDSKVYLYFLQYVLYSKTNKHIFRQKAMDNLRILIDNENENLGHRETAYNLLGWMFVQEKRYRKAFVCFCLSWKIRPDHNAAKWHIMVMIYSVYSKAKEMVYKEQMKTISKLLKLMKSLESGFRYGLKYSNCMTPALEY